MRRLLLLPLAALLSLACAPAALADVSFRIINKSGLPASQVWVMLDGGSSADGRMPADKPVRLSALPGRSFTLASISAGRLYVSYRSPVAAAEPPESKARYDKIEFTYPGVANLTAVDFFSIPFKLQAYDSAGASTGRLAYGAHGADLTAALLRASRGKAGVRGADGKWVRVLSPQLKPQAWPSMRPYVRSVAGKELTVRGAFFGSPYTTYEYSGRLEHGSVRLTGELKAGGAASQGQALEVSEDELAASVYTVDGSYTVGGQPAKVSDNNVYSAIYRDLLSGFAWGYWGGRYGNDEGRWAGKPPFAAARRGRDPFPAFNPYAALICKSSDAYGFAFSDTGPRKVQLPITGARRLDVTILPDYRGGLRPS